ISKSALWNPTERPPQPENRSRTRGRPPTAIRAIFCSIWLEFLISMLLAFLREQRPLAFDVVVHRFPHHPGERDFLLLCDFFESRVPVGWKTDGRPHRCCGVGLRFRLLCGDPR